MADLTRIEADLEHISPRAPDGCLLVGPNSRYHLRDEGLTPECREQMIRAIVDQIRRNGWRGWSSRYG